MYNIPALGIRELKDKIQLSNMSVGKSQHTLQMAQCGIAILVALSVSITSSSFRQYNIALNTIKLPFLCLLFNVGSSLPATSVLLVCQVASNHPGHSMHPPFALYTVHEDP